MKYAVNYTYDMVMDDFNEIIIDFEQQKEPYQLYEFLRAKLPKHIIVCVNDINAFIANEKWHELNTLYQKIDNFTVRLNSISKFKTFDDSLNMIIEKLQVPFFTGYLVTDFDQLHYLLQKGVQQIYIAENICFKMDKVKKVCTQYGDKIKVRCFANIAQTSVTALKNSTLTHFFIRPEDVKRYEKYIDVIEFWGALNKQAILYNIYKKGLWGGNLKEIILGLEQDIDSRCILPQFGEKRATCGRICMEGMNCTVCNQIIEFGEKLKEKGIKISNKYL